MSEDLDIGEALAALNVRLRRMADDTNSLPRQIADERRDRESGQTRLDRELRSAIEDMAEHERTLAITGVRKEASGLLLITIGAVLLAIGSLV